MTHNPKAISSNLPHATLSKCKTPGYPKANLVFFVLLLMDGMIVALCAFLGKIPSSNGFDWRTSNRLCLESIVKYCRCVSKKFADKRPIKLPMCVHPDSFKSRYSSKKTVFSNINCRDYLIYPILSLLATVVPCL